MMTCEDCGSEVNPRSFGWAQWVEGWEKSRKQGGTNALIQPQRKNRYLCPSCVVRVQTVKKRPQDEKMF